MRVRSEASRGGEKGSFGYGGGEGEKLALWKKIPIGGKLGGKKAADHRKESSTYPNRPEGKKKGVTRGVNLRKTTRFRRKERGKRKRPFRNRSEKRRGPVPLGERKHVPLLDGTKGGKGGDQGKKEMFSGEKEKRGTAEPREKKAILKIPGGKTLGGEKGFFF